jgi:hypothetical protein
VAGWWLTYPSEKYEFVSWDNELPNSMGKNHVPNHQPVFDLGSTFEIIYISPG